MAFAGVAVRTMDNLKRCADMFHSIAHTQYCSLQYRNSSGYQLEEYSLGEIGEDALAAHDVKIEGTVARTACLC
jgi:hypothetical protein